MTDKKPEGPIEADRKPEKENGRFDKPSKAEDDFATDEQRDKPIRGPEGHAED